MDNASVVGVNGGASWWHGNPWGIAAAGFAILGAVALSLLNQWEMSAETWGYWFFARLFSESHRFIVLDRSPLYTLYLNAFRWLDYPDSVTLEYIVTSLVLVVSLVVLFRPYLGLSLAVFASILWIPFWQVAEPSVQKLAMACSCWAIVVRRNIKNPDALRFKYTLSYTLLGFSYLFRPTYGVAILTFAAWDCFQLMRGKALGLFFRELTRPRRGDLLLLLVPALLIWFGTMQASHPWNTIWMASTKWFPVKGQSLAESAFFQVFNWQYILKTYGTFEGHDFYMSNREVFDGARSISDAMRSNPEFVVSQLAANVKGYIDLSLSITGLPLIYRELPYVPSLVLMAVLFGAFRACRDVHALLFILSSFLQTVVTSLVLPSARYLPPLTPVLIMSASWYGGWVREMLSSQERERLFRIGLTGVGLISLYLALRVAVTPVGPVLLSAAVVGYALSFCLIAVGRYGSQGSAQRWSAFVGRLAVPLMLVILSNGITNWITAVNVSAGDIRRGEIHVLERGFPRTPEPSSSMKMSFETWAPLLSECKGILALEHTFVGAFANVSLDKVYDVWEIPPFGHLGDSVYNGLRPDRIDCVLVSEVLATGIGMGTNHQIRYENYIKPYVYELRRLGAATYDIPRFGQAVILSRPGRYDGLQGKPRHVVN